mmetsp:Transcript_26790/g.68855  ORF Transcript_26790/g.68855 Transcript_26790/m.68855 type:complete len:155 (-) Transcript_26790:1108-1572(-)
MVSCTSRLKDVTRQQWGQFLVNSTCIALLAYGVYGLATEHINLSNSGIYAYCASSSLILLLLELQRALSRQSLCCGKLGKRMAVLHSANVKAVLLILVTVLGLFMFAIPPFPTNYLAILLFFVLLFSTSFYIYGTIKKREDEKEPSKAVKRNRP